MSTRRSIHAVLTALAMWLPASALGLTISTTVSKTGSYTVSWTEASSPKTRHLYLREKVNAGAWSGRVSVTSTYSKSYSGKAVGNTYSYRLEYCYYDIDTVESCDGTTSNVVSVVVTTSPPGAPASITAPALNLKGSYSVSWAAVVSAVQSYELQENGATIYTGMDLTRVISGRTNGTYAYRARACNLNGCSAYTAAKSTVVQLSLSETVADAPLVQPTVPAQEWVGAIPGTPSADGGSAQYRIPIEVPPGRNGMQPEIALTYSSQSGNGVVGVGWSLSVGSTIYRCPRTLEQEGANAPVSYTMNDRLCLDGKRLVAVSGSYGSAGSEYRTEVDEFARITLHDAGIQSRNSYFVVEWKSGRKSVYQAHRNWTSSTTWLPSSPPDTWHVAREYDAQGNCMSYRYSLFNQRAGGEDQEWVLASIDYSSNSQRLDSCLAGQRTVSFDYDADREDKRTTYRYGVASMSTARLKAIRTETFERAVRRYELSYVTSTATRRSLLESVRLCAGATCGSDQLPPTTFEYQREAGSLDFAVEPLMDSTGVPMDDSWRSALAQSADLDGDGAPDHVYSKIGGSTEFLLSGSGVISHPHGEGWGDGLQQSDGTLGGRVAYAWDFNHDGRSEIVGRALDSDVIALASFVSGQWVTQKTSLPVQWTRALRGLDWDGDGVGDVVQGGVNGGGIFLGQSSGSPPLFSTNPIAYPQFVGQEQDANGDGSIDIVRTRSNSADIAFYDRSTDGFVYRGLDSLGGPGGGFPGGSKRRWIDVNGDGLPDIYEPGTIWINRGGALTSSAMFQAVSETDDIPSDIIKDRWANDSFAMDVDADGVEELMVPGMRAPGWEYCGGEWNAVQDTNFFWCGAEFDHAAGAFQWDLSGFQWDAYKFQETSAGTFVAVRVPTTLIAPVNSGGGFRPGDYDGDGMPDLVFLVSPMNPASHFSHDPGYYKAHNLDAAPDLLVKATRSITPDNPSGNGAASVAAWAYQPLSAPGSMTACSFLPNDSFYVAHHEDDRKRGYAFFASSMWAVARFEQDNGVNAQPRATCYRYEDAMYNMEGRGFQGFKKIFVEDQSPRAVGEGPAVQFVSNGPWFSPNNLRTTTEFAQEFPFTNRVKRVTVNLVTDAPGATPLSETRTWWFAKQTSSAPVWLVYATGTTEVQNDLLSSPRELLVSKTSISEIDEVSGEAVKECVIIDDAATKRLLSNSSEWTPLSPSLAAEVSATSITQRSSVLENDVAAWWLARPRSTETVADFFTGSIPSLAGRSQLTEGPSAVPLTCPTFTRSSLAKGSTHNLTWYPERLLKSDEVVAAGITENTTAFTYDSYGNPATKKVTARNVVDDLGTKQVMTTTYASTSGGYFIEKETNAAGHVSTTQFDAATGLPTYKQAIQNGPATTITYDSLGRVLSTATDGEQPAYERLAACVGADCGTAVIYREHIQAGAPRVLEYLDRLGRTVATSTEQFDGTFATVETVYNERGIKLAESAPIEAGAQTQYWTQFADIDALGRAQTKTVDRGAAPFSTGQGDAVLRTHYTYSGFRTSISVEKASSVGGRLEMSRTNNAAGKLITTTQNLGTDPIRTRYLYDPAGSVTHIIDTAGNDLAATYDALGRKTRVSDPDRGIWTYSWDGLGRVVSQRDARGVTIVQEYDIIGRPRFRFTQASDTSAQVLNAAWTYDQAQPGLLDRVEGPNDGFVRTFLYDSLLRPSKVTTTFPAQGDIIPDGSTRTLFVQYGYDRNYGRLKAKRFPGIADGGGELVMYDYGSRGHLLGEAELLADGSRGQSYRLVTAMSPRGQVTTQTLGNCASEANQYDSATGAALFMTATKPASGSTPSSLASCAVGTTLVRQVEYGYDHFLNLTQQARNFTGGQATEHYTYDDLQRIRSSQRWWNGTGFPTGELDAYDYDLLGNLTKKSDYATGYSYGTNRITAAAGPHAVTSVTKPGGGSASFSYDANGNMIAGDGRTFDFDAMDRPIGIHQAGVNTTFAYDPDGARFRQVVTGTSPAGYGPRVIYYIDKDYELAVWSATEIEERTYVSDSVEVFRQNGARQLRYLHKDRLGSLDAVTDSTGTVLGPDLHSYDPFGKPKAGSMVASADRMHSSDHGVTTDRGFTGHEHLDVHYLIHMNGRMYDYRLGRFLSVDPFISSPLNSQSINPYSYIGNNPLSGVDPTGYLGACTVGAHAIICGGIDPNSGKPDQGEQQSTTSGANGQGTQTPTNNVQEAESPADQARTGDDRTQKTESGASLEGRVAKLALGDLARRYESSEFYKLVTGAMDYFGALANKLPSVGALAAPKFALMQTRGLLDLPDVLRLGEGTGASANTNGPLKWNGLAADLGRGGTLVLTLLGAAKSAGFTGGGAPTIARITPGSLPAAEEASLLRTVGHIDAGTAPSGSLATKWGTPFKNWAGDLPGPKGSASPYLEYRVAPPAGTIGAGPLRVVANPKTGQMFYTWTHYGDAGAPAFVQIR